MSKSPYTPEFRARVSQKYLDGLDSYDSLAAEYQCCHQKEKEEIVFKCDLGSI